MSSPPLPLRSDVTLTPLGLEHAQRMYAWMLDSEVRDNLGVREQPSLPRTRRWIRHAIRSATIAPFAVLLSGEHVGNVVLDQIDTYLQSARLSVYIGDPAARGKGVGGTAVALALEEAFLTRRLHKVWLTVHNENQPALRLYQRLGFQHEGTHRDEFLLRGRYVPVAYMGILDHDWLGRFEKHTHASDNPIPLTSHG